MAQPSNVEQVMERLTFREQLTTHMDKSVITAAVTAMLYEIEDIDGDQELREGLKKTPERVYKSFMEQFSGYKENPEEILSSVFGEDGLDSYKQLVIVRDIPFYSHCEHHMVPFFGTADVGYIPRDRVVGISKLARLVDCYAKRLQVQERLTQQITDALQKYLQPQGAIAVIRAEHLCMCARGVRKPGSQTITSSITGVFRDNPSAKEEFMFLTDTRR